MRRGFTLIEMTVALAISAIVVIASSEIARYTLSSATRSGQKTELTSRANIASVQIRADLLRAGFGSSGAIGVDEVAWGVPASVIGTTNGYQAMPVVRGLDNVPAGTSIGGVQVRTGSDVMTVVVPGNDPTQTQVTTAFSDLNALVLWSPGGFNRTRNCAMLYVVDHSAPNGSGRTQLLRFVSATANPITLLDNLQFAVPPGSEVTCARVSTWWVSENRELRRSDLDPAAPTLVGGVLSGMYTTGLAFGIPDVVAPGIEDLQIAYDFSRQAPGSAVNARTYGVLVNNYNVTASPTGWFEVRSVRYNLMARALRRTQGPGPPTTTLPLLENRAAALVLAGSYPIQAARAAVELTNLRMFDDSAESGSSAEPY